jgi:hypothetical protein
MPRGSKPGEHRGGRVKGTPNKATAEIKDIARPYGPDCIEKLWAIASSSESDPAKVAAIKEILDRGYGKAAQPIEGKIEASLTVQVVKYADDPAPA